MFLAGQGRKEDLVRPKGQSFVARHSGVGHLRRNLKVVLMPKLCGFCAITGYCVIHRPVELGRTLFYASQLRLVW